jgi:hypothetical protein
MRLKRGQQVGLIIVGLTVFALGVTASAREWPTAGMISLIFPGLLMIVFGLLGVFPNVHLKEGSIDWPKIEEPQPEKPVEDLNKKEIDLLRWKLNKVSTLLDDYTLAHGSGPDDGLTDEKRLEDMQERFIKKWFVVPTDRSITTTAHLWISFAR